MFNLYIDICSMDTVLVHLLTYVCLNYFPPLRFSCCKASEAAPEATRAVLEREAPGISERIRVTSLESFPRAALSRGLAGTRKKTLIINLPGSTGGVKDGLAALDPIIDHAIAVVCGERLDH